MANKIANQNKKSKSIKKNNSITWPTDRKQLKRFLNLMLVKGSWLHPVRLCVNNGESGSASKVYWVAWILTHVLFFNLFPLYFQQIYEFVYCDKCWAVTRLFLDSSTDLKSNDKATILSQLHDQFYQARNGHDLVIKCAACKGSRRLSVSLHVLIIHNCWLISLGFLIIQHA